MSILFDALNKAARDYRRQQTQVVVPLVATTAMPLLYRRGAMVCALGLALIAGGAAGVSLYSSLWNPTTSEQVKAQLASDMGFSQFDEGSAQGQHKTATIAEDDSVGIELPAESLNTDIQTRKIVRGVADKLKDVPAVTDLPARAVAENLSGVQSSIVVSEEAGSRAARKKADMDLAASGLDAKNWDRALFGYSRVLAVDPDDLNALLGKAFVLEQKGGPDDLNALERMIMDKPDIGALHASRARILAQQNNPERAISAWLRAVVLEPGNDAYKLALAITYDKAGHVQEAINAYHAVMGRLSPTARARLQFLESQPTVTEDQLTILPPDSEE